MPRIRTIKPEFWSSPQVVALSLRARLLFIGLWNFADDRGVVPASPSRLKMEIFPGDDVTDKQMHIVVQELLLGELIGEFESGNKGYWYITGWHHQRIDRPSPRYPAPPDVGSNSASDVRAVSEGSPPETETETEGKGNGRETETEGKGNGRETETEGKRKLRPAGRPAGRTEVEKIDWKRNGVLVDELFCRIRKKWINWIAGPATRDKLATATACVQLGVLPDEWLVGVIDEMISDPKPKNLPHRWLGKVLASTAKENHGVDFDQYQRAIKVPKGGAK